MAAWPCTGRSLVRALLGPLFVGLMVGCADELGDYDRTISTAFQDPLSTRAGQLFQHAAAEHPGESGFAIIRHGRQAFTARIAFTELAEHSLDVQYYIWETDATGFILMDRLLRAADRGVRDSRLIDFAIDLGRVNHRMHCASSSPVSLGHLNVRQDDIGHSRALAA